MNEPKKRGRPAKTVVESFDPNHLPERVEFVPVDVDEFARRQAQAYARRVWEGQSISLSRHERLGRVAQALQAQGMSMEGVEL
jgi:hypothetical protein